MKKKKIAFIGCGTWAKKKYLPYLLSRSDVEVASFCNIHYRSEWDQLHSLFPSAVHSETYSQLLKTTPVDGCFISLPHSLIAAAIQACITVKTPVLADKPFSISLEEGTNLVLQAKTKKSILGVCHQRRAYGGIARLKSHIGNNVQSIKWINASFYLNSYPDWKNGWRNDPAYSGVKSQKQGILLDAGYHTVDSILYLLNHIKPTSVYCSAAYRDAKVETDVSCILHFPNDLRASFTISRDIPATHEMEQLEVLTDSWFGKSTIHKTPDSTTASVEFHNMDGSTTQETFDPADAATKPVAVFLDSLETGKIDPMWSAESALPTLQVLDALYVSLIEKRVVSL